MIDVTRATYKELPKQVSQETLKKYASSNKFTNPIFASFEVPTTKAIKKNIATERADTRAQNADISIAEESSPDAFEMNNKDFKKAFITCMQYGHRSKKSEIFKKASEEMPAIKVSERILKERSINTSAIETQRMTFRSGYNAQGHENQLSYLDIMLKGSKNGFVKIKNSGLYGDTSANGHNGWEKNQLYLATYLSSDGVGTRTKS